MKPPNFTVVASLLLLPVLFLKPASAVSWHFLRFYLPPASEFTSLSGTIVVPPLPQAATYYLWPGLQPRDNSGVFQNVLDGRSGTWWFAAGWCCSDPTLPWGGGFNTYPGEVVSFANALGSGSEGWTTTITRLATGQAVTSAFVALAGEPFDQALFAIELYDVAWNFGPLEFRDVTFTATGTDASWCSDTPEDYENSTRYLVSGVSMTMNNGEVTCNIASVILEAPA